jgi:DNA-directed RNA polymerase specialized sigma24 family protein
MEPLPPLSLDPEIDRILWNWGRWARPRSVYATSITGIICERLARENAVFDENPRKDPVDVLQAIEIEKAWQGMGEREKSLTRAHYVLGVDYRKLCRALNIPFRGYDREISRAAMVLASRARLLTTKESVCTLGGNSCISV